MTTGFCVFLMLHTLSWTWAARVYRSWVAHPGGYRWKSAVGLAMGGGCLVSLALPFLAGWNGAAAIGRPTLKHGPEIFLALLCLVVLAGVMRSLSILACQKLLDDCPSEKDLDTPDQVLGQMVEAKAGIGQLHAALRAREGRPIRVLPTELVDRPILVGVLAPRVYVPIQWYLDEPRADEAVVSLARHAFHWRYRIYAAFGWLSQIYLPLRPMVVCIRAAMEGEGAAGLNLPPTEPVAPSICLVSRSPDLGSMLPAGLGMVGQFRSVSRGHQRPWGFFPVLGLTGMCCWTALAFGRLNLREMCPRLFQGQILGYSTHAYDPAVQFLPAPGRGGILPDGIVVDTTHDPGFAGCATVRFPLGLIESEKHIPFGAKAIKVGIEWEILERRSTALEMPALKITCAEQDPIDRNGRRRLVVFYTRNLILPCDPSRQGNLEIPLQLHPENPRLKGSTDVIYGPILYVPSGWKIRFTNYTLASARMHEVPKVPAGEAGTFVAWYRRNGGKPALPDFTWMPATSHRNPG